MKKLTSLTIFTAGMFLALGLHSAKATPISGSINFDGEATTNSGNLATATSFTTIIGTMVVPMETGNYAAIPVVTPVTFTPFSFSAAGVTPLWTLTVGGVTYSFNATSINVQTQNANFLNISGTGVASITGYTDTAGVWSITDTSEGGSPTFVFGADSTVTPGSTVPDGGITALLVVLGLAGIGVGAMALPRKTASQA